MVSSPLCIEPSVGAALRCGRNHLQPSPSASLDSQLLLAYVLGVTRPYVLGHGADSLSAQQVDRYANLIDRRARHVPLAYLRGHTEWYGAEYRVTPDVLIPRPETELLLERAVAIARDRSARTVVDVGTGSGAIASQLALCLPKATVYATDISNPALDVAAENLRRLGVDGRVTLFHGNLVEPVRGMPNLVVANLPYLSRGMMGSLDADVREEPVLALAGGETGLELYRELLVQMEARGWDCPAVLEIDPRQSNLARDLVAEVAPRRRIEIEPDYAGRDRVVVVSRND